MAGILEEIEKIKCQIKKLFGMFDELEEDGVVNTITSPSGSIHVSNPTGDVEIEIDGTILSTINSAIQPGDNVSELNNDVGYLVQADLPDTKAEFNTQLSDGSFLFVGDITQYTDEQSQDAVAAALTDSPTIDFVYDDFINSITAHVKANSITAIELADDVNISEFVNDVNYEKQVNKGVALGYTPLDNLGKVPLIHINDALLGNLKWKGLYNGVIITNSPDPLLVGQPLPAPDVSNIGWYFVSNGTYSYGGDNYTDGDWIISNGVIWDIVDNTDAVSSVFGRTGNIVAVAGDYNTAQVTETTSLYFTTARVLATALSGFSVLLGGAVVSTDTILQGFGKIQNSLNTLFNRILNINGVAQNLTGDRIWRTAEADTGVLTFGGLTPNSATTVNIGAVTGIVVDNETNPAAPTFIEVNYPGETNKAVPTVGSSIGCFVMLSSAGVISFQTTFPTSTERKTKIWLGKIGHPAGAITVVVNEPDYITSPMGLTRDFYQKVNYINTGVYPYANGANLNVNVTGGSIGGNGINFVVDKTNPNNIMVTPSVVAPFIYRTQLGGATPAVTLIDPTSYDLAGVITPVGGGANNSTLQYWYAIPGQGYVMLYGQTIYASLTAAIAAVGKEPLVVYPNLIGNAILLGVLAINRTATQLNNPAEAQFFKADIFGQIIGATAGTTVGTMQTAYQNSLVPQITTTVPLGAITYRNGRANDALTVQEWQNIVGTTTASITGSGDITASGSITSIGNITGNSFIKSGGTAAQFLKADGSIDTNVYITATNVMTTNTNQSGLTGIKTWTNTSDAQINGISLINNGISGSKSLSIINAGGGSGGLLLNTSIGIGLEMTNSNNGYGLSIYNSNVGTAQFIDNISTGRGLSVAGSLTGHNIVSSMRPAGTGFNYVGQNNGTNTFTVDKFGHTTSNSLKAVGRIYSTSDVNIGDLVSTTGAIVMNYDTANDYGILTSRNYAGAVYKPMVFSASRFDFINGNINANAFIKTGGVATEFLMADGSVTTGIPHLEYNLTDKTVWNNGKANQISSTSFGDGALMSQTTGVADTAIGYNALSSLTTGSSNTALGLFALVNITTGSNNMGIGGGAGRYIANGVTALLAPTDSIFIGGNAKALADGASNEIVIGNNATGAGSNSVMLGSSAITKTILNGDVGIGVVTPLSKLHVASTTSDTKIKVFSEISSSLYQSGIEFIRNNTLGGAKIESLRDSATGGVGLVFATTATNAEELSGTYVNKMVLLNNGNVGIGTTSAVAKLTINAIANSNDNAILLYNNNDVAGSYTAIGSYYSNGNTNVNSQIRFGNEQAGNSPSYLAFATGTGISPLEKMRITSTGNVGIGVADPKGKIHTAGKTIFAGQGNTTPVLGTTASSFTINAGNYNTSYGLQLGFYSSGTTWMQAQADDGATLTPYAIALNPLGGNVGIGETNPSDKLVVNGTISNFDSTNDTRMITRHTGGYVEIVTSNNAFGASKNLVINNAFGGNVGIGTTSPSEKLHVIGNILASGSITPSDRRLKSNIIPLENSLEKILAMKPVSYDKAWEIDGEPQNSEYGFIAQELKEIFTDEQVVKTPKEKDGILGVNYISLIAVLTKGMQEQQLQIEELKNRLENLEK